MRVDQTFYTNCLPHKSSDLCYSAFPLGLPRWNFRISPSYTGIWAEKSRALIRIYFCLLRINNSGWTNVTEERNMVGPDLIFNGVLTGGSERNSRFCFGSSADAWFGVPGEVWGRCPEHLPGEIHESSLDAFNHKWIPLGPRRLNLCNSVLSRGRPRMNAFDCKEQKLDSQWCASK